MGIGKIIGLNLILFTILNFIFMVIYAAIGGVGGSIGVFFSQIPSDIGGFLTALFTQGGNQATLYSSLVHYAGKIANPSIFKPIVALLWVIVPGFIVAIFSGKKSRESPKRSFWGVFIALFILAFLPLIIVYVPSFGIIAQNHPIVSNLVPEIYWTIGLNGAAIAWSPMMYLAPLLAGLVNAMFWGGIAALSSSNL
ncbi:MAG: hypothetical protein ACTSVU_01090 [Promethearchaeota archaeon]